MPERRREATQHLVYQGLLSIAKACRLTGLSRRSWYRPDPKQNRLKRDQPIVDALNTIIQDSTRSRWGGVVVFSPIKTRWQFMEL